jgi:hypothetical protein
VEGPCGSLLQPPIDSGGAYTATSLDQAPEINLDLPDEKKAVRLA